MISFSDREWGFLRRLSDVDPVLFGEAADILVAYKRAEDTKQ